MKLREIRKEIWRMEGKCLSDFIKDNQKNFNEIVRRIK